MKHLDLQLKEFGQQFSEQVKCLDSKVAVDNSILSNILDLYKRRAAIEQSYADSLMKLSSNITQRNNLDSQKRPKWKNYSPVKILHSLLVSTEHTARAHKNLGDIYGKQMTQRIMDIQDDCARLTKRCAEILQHRHLQLLESVNKLSVKQKNYSKLFVDADDCRRKADKVLDQLDREVVKCLEKKKEVDKNFKIKKLKEEYLEKLKALKDKYVDCTTARNKYVINLDSINDSVQHFYSSELHTIVQCSQYGFHNNLTRLAMNHNSCEEALSTVHCSIRDLFTTTMDQIDGSNDIAVFLDAHRSVFGAKEQMRYTPAKDDNVNDILKIEHKIEKNLQTMHDKFDTKVKKISKDLLDKEVQISEATKELNDLISQLDYDVVNYVCRKSSTNGNVKERSTSNAKENVCDILYSYVQKKVKDPKLQAEINYFKLMEEYLNDQISIVGITNKLKNIDSALRRPMDFSESFYTKRTEIHRQTAIMVGMRSKLFGGDLRKYSMETKEMVPLVVRSCIRLINLYGMKNIGVFRVPGSQFEVQLNKSQFELGLDPNKVLVGNANDVNLAASLLKLYFRELDPPMFDEIMLTKIVDMYNSVKQNEPAIVEFMKKFVETLHPAVYATLTYLLAFLDHLSEFSYINCMDILNLAIIFGPCLMPIPEDRNNQLFQFQAIINHITKCLITHREEIFTRKSIGPHYLKDQSSMTLQDSINNDAQSATETNRTPFFSESSMDSVGEGFTSFSKTIRKLSLENRYSCRGSFERSRTSSVASSINLNSGSCFEPSIGSVKEVHVQKYPSFSEIYTGIITQDNKVNEIELLSQPSYIHKDSDAASVDSNIGSGPGEIVKKMSLGSINSECDLEYRSHADTDNSPLLEIPPEFADQRETKSPASMDSIGYIDSGDLITNDCVVEIETDFKLKSDEVKIRRDSRSIVSTEQAEAVDQFDDELVQTRQGLQKIEQSHVHNHRNTILVDNARLASKFLSPLYPGRPGYSVIEATPSSQTLHEVDIVYSNEDDSDDRVHDTSAIAPPIPPRLH